MAPNGQTGKPACLLRLKIGFRNLGFFSFKNMWEHNKKLVKISFVSTNLLFWIPKPLKENLNKEDTMHVNVTCTYDKIGNSKPPEKFDWMTFAHGFFHTSPLTFPLYTLEAHTILMAKNQRCDVSTVLPEWFISVV